MLTFRPLLLLFILLLYVPFTFAGEVDQPTIDAFFTAIKAKDAATVEKLLQDHPTLAKKRKRPGSSTAIIDAAYAGSLEVATLLLKAGADCKAEGIGGDLPLHIAALHGHADIVEAILATGISVNQLDRAGSTALHKAAHLGKINVVKLLLSKKCKIVADNKGYTPMIEAQAERHQDVIDILMKAGMKIGIPSLVVNGDAAAINKLKTALARNKNLLKVKVKTLDLLELAIHHWRLESAALLMEMGMKPTADHAVLCVDMVTDTTIRRGLLRQMVKHGLKKLDPAIMKKGVYISLGDRDGAGAEDWLAMGLDPNTAHEDWGPLIVWAAQMDAYTFVTKLVEAGAKVDVKNKEGKTALDYLKNGPAGNPDWVKAHAAVRKTLGIKEPPPEEDKGDEVKPPAKPVPPQIKAFRADRAKRNAADLTMKEWWPVRDDNANEMNVGKRGDLRLFRAVEGKQEKAVAKLTAKLIGTKMPSVEITCQSTVFGTRMAIAVKTGKQWTYFESPAQLVPPPDEWDRVLFDLKAKDFKSEASGWKHKVEIDELDDIREIQILVFNNKKTVDVIIEGIHIASTSPSP